MSETNPRDQVSLYLYDELEDSERIAFEAELERSPELRTALETEQAFLRSLNVRRGRQPSDGLLAECRHDLMREVYRSSREPASQSWWASFIAGLSGMRVAWQPTAAFALVALGFWGGSSTGGDWRTVLNGPGRGSSVNGASMVAGPSAASTEVQSVRLDELGGDVEIVIEERRTIRGNPQDPFIRQLLISSVEGSYSGVRLESLQALGQGSGDAEVRRAMIQALLRDENPGVRLNALSSLAAHQQEPEVRAALVQALQTDSNPGVRVQAIDLLTATPDSELTGMLQQLVRNESNSYVRLRSEQALQAMNASVELY